MASYDIPEEIIGVPLFVPDGNDYFEIVSGGMPNGDDCLRVRGDISADYKAFQPAPTTSPNISANMTIWSFTIWIKGPAGASASTSAFDRCILSMMNASNASAALNSNGLFALASNNTTAGLRFNRGITTSTTASTTLDTSGTIRDDTWHMVTIHTCASAGATTASLFIDNASVAAVTDTQTSGSAPAAGQFLCIGKYSDLAGPTAWAVDYQIGKIAFHDHQLNQTERSLLWEAMTS